MIHWLGSSWIYWVKIYSTADDFGSYQSSKTNEFSLADRRGVGFKCNSKVPFSFGVGTIQFVFVYGAGLLGARRAALGQ